MATVGRGKWLIVAAISVVVLASAAYAFYRPQGPVAPFSLQVVPESIQDSVPGQRCVFLVVVEDEGPGTGEGETIGISATATAISSSVTVNPHTITPGQVAEVTVIPEEESANSTLTLTVTGERDGLQKTKTTTVEVGEGLVVDGHDEDEDPMGTLAAEIRDKFIPWLAANHPELGVTKETEWTGTIVRPHILVVMYYLFFSEDWEMGVQWHVTIEPHNWARIYLRGRFSEVCPSYAFELSSWTAEDYEICAIDPPESVWR